MEILAELLAKDEAFVFISNS